MVPAAPDRNPELVRHKRAKMADKRVPRRESTKYSEPTTVASAPGPVRSTALDGIVVRRRDGRRTAWARPTNQYLMIETTTTNLNWIASYIWGIADDVLRDVYVRGKYRDVILPMTVLRRLDAVLEPTKQAVLDMKAALDRMGIVDQDAALGQAAGQQFYNTSKFTLHDLRARASRQQLKADFEDYLDGFSPNVQDILENFEFRNLIPKLSKADALGTLIEKLTSPDINLSPAPVIETDGTVRHAGLDNHGMGTVFEELIRRFNEENNEEAGEHFTPRDTVTLMAKLVLLPIADEIQSRHLSTLRRRLRNRRHADRGRGCAAAARRGAGQARCPPTSTARRSTVRPTPSAKPTSC